jgi:hypothetical protein
MGNPHKPSAGVGGPQSVDATAQMLIALIDEFTMVVGEENATLARGLPSSFALIARRKNELATQFEAWVKAAVAREFQVAEASPAVRARFVERLTRFQSIMNENLVQLEAAMQASRLRIEAIMTAIRDEMADASPYGANGKTRRIGAGIAMRLGSYV